MNRASILRKVKACLRLAASSNAHEAAAALRQAQAMMAAHAITVDELSDVGEVDISTRHRGQTPPRSIVMLASICADGFGATVVIVGEWRRTWLRFYGVDGAAEIASYAFTVLRRQLDRDRLKHIGRVRKRGNRDARGEVFALAWVSAVAHLFPQVVVPEERRLAIDEVIRLRHPASETTTGRELTTRGKVADDDSWAGHRAGKNAQLRAGIKGAEPHRLEQTQ